MRSCILSFFSIFVIGAISLSCTTLPRSGPTKLDIYKSSYGQMPIIPINADVVRISNQSPKHHWLKSNDTKSIRYETLDVGDKLEIMIWENASERLYSSKEKGAANLGPTRISGSGYIDIPYAGRIKAAGLTIEQLQKKLIAKLKNKIIHPQVILKKIEGLSQHVSIQGTIAKPGTYEIVPAQHDLLSLLAEAGGSTLPPEVTSLKLERKGEQFKITLNELYHFADNNINLLPKDALILSEINRSFNVLGATGVQRLIKFPKSQLSFIEGIALAEGLNDEIANPSGVYLLRYETSSLISQMVPSFKGRIPNGFLPVIYELNMRDIEAVFSAQHFQIRNNDLIITTDAPYTNIRKIFSSLSPAIGLGRNF